MTYNIETFRFLFLAVIVFNPANYRAYAYYAATVSGWSHLPDTSATIIRIYRLLNWRGYMLHRCSIFFYTSYFFCPHPSTSYCLLFSPIVETEIFPIGRSCCSLLTTFWLAPILFCDGAASVSSCCVCLVPLFPFFLALSVHTGCSVGALGLCLNCFGCCC